MKEARNLCVLSPLYLQLISFFSKKATASCLQIPTVTLSIYLTIPIIFDIPILLSIKSLQDSKNFHFVLMTN